MTHTNLKSRFYGLLVILLFIFALSAPAHAVVSGSNGQNDSAGSGSTQGQGSENSSGEASQGAQSKGLNSEQKNVCQQSENRVQNMFSNMNRVGEAQLSFMNTVAERVQNYANDNGVRSQAYDEALAKVTQERQAAQEMVQAAVQTSSQYGCDKDDPKGTAQQYKTQVKAEISALKDYRSAIKDLINVVKDADGGQE